MSRERNRGPEYVEVLCEVDCLVSVEEAWPNAFAEAPSSPRAPFGGLSQPWTERRPVRGVAGLLIGRHVVCLGARPV